MTAHSIGAMIERQIGRWNLETRDAKPLRRPCVAISRLPGSGAAELAQRLADHLGYCVFDKQAVELVAKDAGVSARLVEGLDRHVRSTIDRYVNDGFRGGHFTESDYLRHLVRVVTTLGQRGGVVLLGRGSPFILPPDQALRLLFVAPLETRVERLARERSLTLQAATDAVEREDVERRKFLRHHFGVDQADARLYDLSLNLGMLSLEVAERLVGEALRDRFPHSAPAKALRSPAR